MSEPNTGSKGSGLKPNTAGILCYVLGWITGIIFLLLDNKNEYVRFHAIQSIIVFGAATVIDAVFTWFLPLVWVVNVIAFILWIVLMVKAAQGEKFKLPISGNLAEKYAKIETK